MPSHFQIGDLLRDWRRINVSFTRAKKKLIIFGSRKTLQSDKLLEDFFALMESKNWIRQLSPGADSLHGGLLGLRGGTTGLEKVEQIVKKEVTGRV